ncbi:MAG: DNA polymerase III subunit delta' [Carbonactinosporaceae bacterium]
MSVWADLVGQESVVRSLSAVTEAAADVVSPRPGRDGVQLAAAAPGEGAMTHAWLFTGPPGSGRSIAARSFAAALQCLRLGCGHCGACHQAIAGTHADVDLLRTDLLSIGVGETRELVRRAALSPAGSRWQIIVMEDADRLTEAAGNVLLKAIEEPAPRTVWMLCAPSLEDVLPTVRSRCRHVRLRTPPTQAVAEVLVRRDGVEPEMAAFAARAAQGHIGRARRLATDELARLHRQEVLKLPLSLVDAGSCVTAAANLVDAADEEAKQVTGQLDARETESLRTALGAGTRGRAPAGLAGAVKELEARQKKRATRLRRDAVDRALIDLATFYRDVLTLQLEARVDLTNGEFRPAVERAARSSTAEATLRRLEAVLACREAIDANVAPLLAVEAMTLALALG